MPDKAVPWVISGVRGSYLGWGVVRRREPAAGLPGGLLLLVTVVSFVVEAVLDVRPLSGTEGGLAFPFLLPIQPGQKTHTGAVNHQLHAATNLQQPSQSRAKYMGHRRDAKRKPRVAVTASLQ